MRIGKRNLILWILVLGLCIGAAVLALIFRANKESKLAIQSTADKLASQPQAEKEEGQLRDEIVKALTKTGKNTTVEPLIVALNNGDTEVLWRAVKVLGDIGDTSVIEPFTIALKDKDRRVRYRAIEALEKIGDSRVIEPLISVLKDEDMDIRERVGKALVKIGNPTIEPLIGALEHEDNNYARLKAVEILGEIGDERAVNLFAVNLLVAVLKDKDTNVQMKAAEAMVKIGKPAIEPLIIEFKDENEFGRWQIAAILSVITGEDFGADFEKWQKWWDENKDIFTTEE